MTMDGAADLAVTGTMLTHVGRVRELNEDVVEYVLPDAAASGGRRGLFALVADGMGGHAAGEVASRLAADTIRQLFYELEGPPPDVLRACFEAANEAIYALSMSDPACAGMGTTCTVLTIRDGQAFLAHIGDSRAYLLRNGTLYQLSQDHSLVAAMVRDGLMTPQEAARSPERNVILRALGTEPRVEPDIWCEGLPVLEGDVFLLCSDGLTDLVDDKTIEATLKSLIAFDACHALLDAALNAGGTDNISIGVFDIGARKLEEVPPGDTRPMPRRVLEDAA